MKINKSGARYSAIVGIGEKIKKVEKNTGNEYLYLNRGLPAVCLVNLDSVVPLLDFNSAEMQTYPRNNGLLKLREAINNSYFGKKSHPDHIFITHGGMGTIDLVMGTLDVEEVLIPKFYWGAYRNIMAIHQQKNATYENYEYLLENKSNLKHKAVIICDPSNPLGDKYNDEKLLLLIEQLDSEGITILFDAPYRKLFIQGDDLFYQKMAQLPNVIIMESFSKSVGLSGQRIGFMHSLNKEFNQEFNIRLLYTTNGVNAFAQNLVYLLLTTPEGIKAANNFREKTIEAMQKNINYLHKKGLLAEEFYQDSTPVGIFSIVNKSEEELLSYRIGSVGLPFFTSEDKEKAKKYSRICIAVKHDKFVKFFDAIQ